jgi:hypothetical protein
MPKFSCGRCVRILAEFLGMLHISLVNLLISLFSFFISSLQNGTA